jgi:hypothetical protein
VPASEEAGGNRVPTFALYRQAQLNAWSGGINWGSDTIVATLHTSAYTPNLDTDAFVSNLTGEVAAGGGYATGGQLLTARSAAYLPAGSWPDSWAPVTPYVIGQVVRPALSPALLFRCYAAGTSGSVAPSWPSAVGADVSDGSASWTAIGAGAVTLTASSLQWASFTASFRYVVLSDRTPGLSTAQPLIGLADYATMVTGQGGNLNIVFDSGSGSGIVHALLAP